MNVDYKNYLEHEICVKFSDYILEHNQDLQWFIDYIEENYNLSDVESFSEFNDKMYSFSKLVIHFIKILDICNRDFEFKSPLLKEMYLISKYYVGIVKREECLEKINTEFSKTLFLLVWLTKLYNEEKNSKSIVDIRFLTQKNFHQSINIRLFNYDKEEILLYLEKINLIDFDEAKQNLEDNLENKIYGVSESFFEKYESNLLSVNCFSHQLLKRENNLTWQENTLLDMLQLSIREGKIIPVFSSGESTVPSYNIWTSDLLENLKNYFDNIISNYVIESIDFLLNKKEPSQEVIELHCNLFIELINNGDDKEILSSSTYEILTMLYKNGIMDKIQKTQIIKDFYKTLNSINSINILLKIKNSFPIDKKQIRIVKNYIENQYKNIFSINDTLSLLKYLENIDIARYIEQEYYSKIKDKFLEIIKVVKDISVASLFYSAMRFLLEINQTNQNVDKRIIKQDMINLQKYWQYNIYNKHINNFHRVVNEINIPTFKIEEYNNLIMDNPIKFADNCIKPRDEDMLFVMKEAYDEHLFYMISKIEFNKFFPLKSLGINFYNHKIDDILKTQVKNILKKYGNEFLNLFNIETYVSIIHKSYIENVNISISIFNKEKELYDLLETCLEAPLIQYDKNIKLGHLTQLFPLLELEIRKLGEMFGIVSFKENLNDFMKLKSPSSILIELVGNIFEELESFESAPDLLFVYHFMYNSNSLNIRNECIHGREYIEGEQLKFAFKVTLLALYMIKYRIKLILNNKLNN